MRVSLICVSSIPNFCQMHLNSCRLAAFTSLLLLIGLPATAPHAAAQGPFVSVMIDFGDGTYAWSDVELPVANVTAMKAVELAAASLGVALEVTWFSSPFCLRNPCAFVDDIGAQDPVLPVWWHFYLWNATASTWDVATYGPSDTDLSPWDAIGFYLAVDDPLTFAMPRPVPAPDFRDVWTSFRGDLGNSGRGHGTVPVTNSLLWDHDVGVLEIDTTPVVAYGMVYVGTRNGLFALDAETGQEMWRNSEVRSLLSTPAVYDGHLVLGGIDGRLHYADAFNGTEAWNVLLEPGTVSTGIASSPAVYMGRAYIGTFNETAGGMGRVAAVNLNNGTVAWTYETASVHMSQPAIRGGNLYVGVMGVYDGDIGYAPPHGLLSLTLTGAFRWFFPTNGSVASSPVVDAQRVYFTSKDGRLHALRFDGTTDWVRTIGPSTSSPVLVEPNIYVAAGELPEGNETFGYVIQRFDTATGEPPLPWPDPIPSPIPDVMFVFGAVQASLVSDGRLLCTAVNHARGYHFCFTTDFDSAWSYTPVPNQYVLGTPTIAGDTVYAPSDNGHVYAFRDATPETAPLADLAASGPPRVSVGAPVTLQFEVRSLGRGTAEGVLRIGLPAGLRQPSESLEQARAPRTVIQTVGTLWQGAVRGVNLTVVPMAGYASYDVRADFNYSDLAGRFYPPPSVELHIVSESASLGEGSVVWAAGVLGVAVAAATLVVLMVRRRRRRA